MLNSVFKKIIENKMLLVILISSFLITLAYSFYFRIEPVVDAQAYDDIAINIIDGFGFIEDRTLSFEQDKAIVRAGPGYEYLLAGIYKIFGHHYEPVWVIQAMLHIFSVLLIFLTAKLLFGEQKNKMALIAAALFAFSPDLIEISAMIMSETLYLFFTVSVLYLFVRTYNNADNKLLSVITGFIVGVAILTRPPILLFVPIFLFFYFRKKQYFSIGLFLLFIIIPILPWVVRNYLIYNQLILTTMVAEYNLWVGNTLLSDGGQISGGFNALTNYTDRYGFLGLKEKAGAEFRGFLFMHPFIFIKLCFLRFVRYFSLIRPMGFWFYQYGVGQMIMVVSSLVWIAFLFVTGFSGMVRALYKKKEIFYYLIILALTSPLALIPTVVQSRYRFQIYPFLCIFAGYFIVFVLQNKKDWHKKNIFYMPALFLIFISIIDILFNLEKIIERLKGFF